VTNKITCIVVDDDAVDRMTALAYIEEFDFMEVIGVFSSPVEALAAAGKIMPDALFLDIDMPGMNGLELRKKLMEVPACIFVTSYPDYAVEGFETAALDFLVKPFSSERFAKAMERLQQYVAIFKKAALLAHTIGADTVFIKDGHGQVKLQLHEIIYLEALKNYTRIVTAGKTYTILTPLGTLVQDKSFGNFIRIHRSYAVQKHFIKRINTGEVIVNDIALPVGRMYKNSLKEMNA
jgi:two-component system, LytTR family, response regulator